MTTKETENRKSEMRSTYSQIGAKRVALILDNENLYEHKIFMKFIELQNAIGEYEDYLQKQIDDKSTIVNLKS